MGIEVYFKEDIVNILRAVASVDCSAENAHAGSTYSAEYHKGVRAALTAMGLAFGLGPKIGHWRAEGPTWIGVETNG